MSFLHSKMLQTTIFCLCLSCLSFFVHAQEDTTDVYNLTLEELMNIDVFSASKKKQKLMEAPAIMSVVSKAEIDRMGVLSLIDVLKFVPGIETSMAPDGSYRLAIRGNRKDGNVLLLINGQQMNDFYTGRAFFDLPAAMIEKIEIIRGPGSALFGSNAVAGVINVFLPEETVIQVMAGINNTAGANFQLTSSKNDFKFSIRGGMQQSSLGAGYIDSDVGDKAGNTWNLTYDSLRYKTNRSNRDAFLNLNLEYKKFSFYTTSFLRTQSDWAGTQFIVAPESQFDVNQNLIGASYEFQANEYIKLIPKVYSSFISRSNTFQETPKGYFSNLSLDTFPDGRITKEDYLAKMYGAELDLYIKLSDRLNLLTGNIFEDLSLARYDITRNYMIVGDQYQNTFGNYDDIQLVQNGKRRFVFAYFLQADYKWNRLNMTLGFRYDDYSDFGSSLNPRLGLNYKLSEKWRLKGLYGKAFRAPTFQELYDNTTLGNQYGIKGNDALRPETIQTIELGVEHKRDKLLLKYNGYYNHNKHLIRIYDPHGGGSIGVFQNIGTTQTIGHELELVYDAHKNVQFFANFSQFLCLFDWDEANVSKADVVYYNNQDRYYKQMLNMPTIRVNTGITVSLKKFTLFGAFNYGSAAYNNRRFYLEKGSFVEIPAYVQANFMLNYQLHKKWGLRLAVNNIGRKYADPDESTNVDAYGTKGLIQPGMNGTLSITFKVN